MRLKSIQIEAFVGVKKADLTLTAPVTIVAGPNESGKTSIAEAIRLAWLGQIRRVEKKGDLPGLIRRGAKKATIFSDAELPDGTPQTVSVSITQSKADGVPSEKNTPLALLSVWDSEYLVGLDTTALRKSLFGLAHVDMSIESIKALALQDGVDPTTLTEALPFLKAGFPAAVVESRSRSSEARAIWKSITGEVYGSEKAKTWMPEVPGMGDVPALEDLTMTYQGLGKRVAELEAQLSAADGAERALAEYSVRVARAEKEAGAPEWHTEIAAAEKSLRELEAEKARIEEDLHVVAPRQREAKEAMACPCCKAKLVMAGKSLEVYEPEAEQGDIVAHTRLTQERQDVIVALRTAGEELAGFRRKQAAVDAARTTLETLRTNPPMQVKDFDPADARARRDALVAEQVAVSGQISEARALETARGQADRKAKEAAQAHRDVERWTKAEEVFSPDGLPAKILGRAIGPMNAVLQRSSELAGWGAIEITPSIDISYRAMGHAFASESGQWRANAMLVHALAQLHGIKTVILDRMDLLDLPSRGQFLKWAQAIHAETGIQFLVFATLKEAPKAAGVDGWWMQDGVLSHAV